MTAITPFRIDVPQSALDDLNDRLAPGSNLVLAGFMTHMCINSTARGAFNLGFAPTVVAAATATRDLPGTDGRIWIREYQPPADTSLRRWVAFSRDGRFDCQLRAPDYGVEEIGADYMLVVHRDSLGVERVKQFKLSNP